MSVVSVDELVWSTTQHSLENIQLCEQYNAILFHLSVDNWYLWVSSIGLTEFNSYLTIYISEYWPKSKIHMNVYVPDCSALQTPALLPPSTPLILLLLALTFPMHIKVCFLFAQRCTWSLRGWHNLMPPLISKHHCYPPTRHFSADLIWTSCSQRMPNRSGFTVSATSFLKIEKELYLLSAQINSWSARSGGWWPTFMFLLYQREFTPKSCFSQDSALFPRHDVILRETDPSLPAPEDKYINFHEQFPIQIVFIKQLNRRSMWKSNSAVHWPGYSFFSNIYFSKPLFHTLNKSSSYFTPVLQEHHTHYCLFPNMRCSFREKHNLWFCRIFSRWEKWFSHCLQKIQHLDSQKEKIIFCSTA